MAARATTRKAGASRPESRWKRTTQN
uniref:Uncharacterized protein n=1 Tax=Arundo donax TaxID=35708 RepID=A0A0A9A794_ARUDO